MLVISIYREWILLIVVISISKGTIPNWLLILEDEYQLDVSSYPERIELKKSINQIRLKELCQTLRIYGYLYKDPLKTFLKGDDAYEI